MIETEDDLRGRLGRAEGLAVQKARPGLDRYSRQFIAMSPFLVLSTAGANGKGDVSPRGDPPGFVQVIDDQTFLIPDRPGNNRLDTMVNIIENPNVACLFLIPGFEDTLRVAGRARITHDATLLSRCTVNGKQPKVGVLVSIDEVFLHCAKALKRSKLWQDDYRQDRSIMPSIARIILEQTRDAGWMRRKWPKPTLWSRTITGPRCIERGRMSVNVSARLRIAPALLIGGAVVLAIGTFLHPSSADPNVPELAFAEYAADGLWIYSHLLQLAGIGAMFLGLVLLGQGLSKPLDAMVAVLAAINIALAAALQAVDGVALKHMVDLWARSEGPARDIAFGAAYAVRQIEIGLASMFSLVGGATTIFLALVLSAGGQFPRWTACLGGAAGAATVLAGLIMARSGFSPLEMTVAMPAGLLLLAWAIALGVIGWRGV